jgi:serine/threonine protein kinase
MALTELTGEVLDEKYRIEQELGKGGMGSVYQATHLGTDRPVAVKVIAPQFMMNDEFVERFRREAKAAGRLHHPNVVNVTDFGFALVGDERVAYLVMEYLDGCTLADILAEESQLQVEWVVDIIEQTCFAVDEAHRQGIIHRDLKPDNIWLEPNRRGGYTVKVLDFGLAKLGEAEVHWELPPVSTSPAIAASTTAVASRDTRVTEARTYRTAVDSTEAVTQVQRPSPGEEEKTMILADRTEAVTEAATQVMPAKPSEAAIQVRPALSPEEAETRVMGQTTAERLPRQTVPADGLTRVGSILGTPLYMSPEQCRGEPLDARSDIYSLGVIAYQMLAGEPPFTGTAAEVMQRHIDAPPPPLKAKRRKIRRRMAAVVMSALAKQPAERPATAAGFASALRANSEGTGALMRRAFALYVEHFPKFFRATLLMYLPLMVLHGALLVSSSMKPEPAMAQITSGRAVNISASPVSITEIVLAFLTFVVNFLINAVIAGATIRLVTQLFLAPLRPLSLRTAYKAVRRRLKPLLITLARGGISAVLGLFLLVIPGVLMFINYSLATPVVMMEGLRGKAALKRSKSLVKRSRRTVIAILFIQWLIPALVASAAAALIAVTLKLSSAEHARLFTSRLTGMMTAALNVLIVPFIATLTALLYLKTRQLGGETLKEVLSLLEEDDVPRTKWQMRMRERLGTTTRA